MCRAMSSGMRNILIALFYCGAICGAGLYAAGSLFQAVDMVAAFLNWR